MARSLVSVWLLSSRVGHQPWVCRHLRFRYHVARVVQVRAVPVIGVAAADPRQVRAGALRAPEERVIPDAFTGHRVVTVAFGLGAERADHLRMATHAAFADINVAAFQLQRGVGLYALHRLIGHVLEEQRDDLRSGRRCSRPTPSAASAGRRFSRLFRVSSSDSSGHLRGSDGVGAGCEARTVRQVL